MQKKKTYPPEDKDNEKEPKGNKRKHKYKKEIKNINKKEDNINNNKEKKKIKERDNNFNNDLNKIENEIDTQKKELNDSTDFDNLEDEEKNYIIQNIIKELEKDKEFTLDEFMKIEKENTKINLTKKKQKNIYL